MKIGDLIRTSDFYGIIVAQRKRVGQRQLLVKFFVNSDIVSGWYTEEQIKPWYDKVLDAKK